MRATFTFLTTIILPLTGRAADNAGQSDFDRDPITAEMRAAMQEQTAFCRARAAIHKSNPDEREVATFPKIAVIFANLRRKLQAVERRNATVLAEISNKKATVIAMRVDQPTDEQAAPVNAELDALSKRFKQTTAEARVISQEAEMLRREFLAYPNPFKFLVVTDSYETGKVRLWECFMKFKNREVVTAEGGVIQYGNDFPAEDKDVLSNEGSWARRCYSHLFTFNPLGPANARQ